MSLHLDSLIVQSQETDSKVHMEIQAYNESQENPEAGGRGLVVPAYKKSNASASKYVL